MKTTANYAIFFLQHCARPRVLMSPADALYVHKFIWILSEVDALPFNGLAYHDKVGNAM